MMLGGSLLCCVDGDADDGTLDNDCGVPMRDDCRACGSVHSHVKRSKPSEDRY
jgi:hypothetical protein